MKKYIFILAALLVVGGGVFLFVRSKSNGKVDKFKKVAVGKSTIVEKALAIGKIDPVFEIVVKSQVSGIVDELYKEVGDFVQQGEPLMVVKPEPTPLELADARRALELTTLNREQSGRDLERIKQLQSNSLVPEKDLEIAQKNYQEAELRELQTRERLELIEKGKSKVGGRQVESVIRSPITGQILERLVNRGDPVVPLTSYMPGTELMKMANMENLIFTGTVDEIDVGKLKEGMPAEINIGALPADTLRGELYFISPKSRTKDNAIVFDIKIRITDPGKAILRAGYSANASVIIRKKEDVTSIAERLIVFRNDTSYVNIGVKGDSLEKKAVKVGISDGLTIEVLEGLAEGDTIYEEPPKKERLM